MTTNDPSLVVNVSSVSSVSSQENHDPLDLCYKFLLEGKVCFILFIIMNTLNPFQTLLTKPKAITIDH